MSAEALVENFSAGRGRLLDEDVLVGEGGSTDEIDVALARRARREARDRLRDEVVLALIDRLDVNVAARLGPAARIGALLARPGRRWPRVGIEPGAAGRALRLGGDVAHRHEQRRGIRRL